MAIKPPQDLIAEELKALVVDLQSAQDRLSRMECLGKTVNIPAKDRNKLNILTIKLRKKITTAINGEARLHAELGRVARENKLPLNHALDKQTD